MTQMIIINYELFLRINDESFNYLHGIDDDYLDNIHN